MWRRPPTRLKYLKDAPGSPFEAELALHRSRRNRLALRNRMKASSSMFCIMLPAPASRRLTSHRVGDLAKVVARSFVISHESRNGSRAHGAEGSWCPFGQR
jgi:hypothetical protein